MAFMHHAKVCKNGGMLYREEIVRLQPLKGYNQGQRSTSRKAQGLLV